MRKVAGISLSLLSLIALLGIKNAAYCQSGIFDRTGAIPGHGSYSSLPEESVDLFTGNLTLSYRDIFLPGPNGLNIEVWRVYNSKILQDRQSSQGPTVQAYPKSMVGIGWNMHMGMVHKYLTDTPIIEFPDGRRETAYPPKSEYGYGSTIRLTREFLKYDKGGPYPKLYFKNGLVWTFGNPAALPLADGSFDSVLMVTKIEDSYGNYIEIEYDALDTFRSIKKISDCMGREVRFAKNYPADGAKLAEIRIRNYDDSHDVVYSYSVDSFANGFYRLMSFTPPILPATTYEYNDGQSSNYELTKVKSSYGGILEYSYENHDFYFNTIKLDSRVVSQKKITFNPDNPGEQTNIWNYTYPTYQGVTSGIASVQGPEYGTQATHYAYDNSYPWRIGLESSQAVGDGNSSSSFVWTYYEFSNTTWSVLGTSMGKAKGPLVYSATRGSTGEATLKQQYYFERTPLKRYGLPTKVGLFVNGSASAKSYTELTYYFEAHSSFFYRYMLYFAENEKEKSGSGEVLKETIKSYFEEDGKWGALKQLKKWWVGSFYYTWDFTYSGSDPTDITITTDGPGEGGISWVTYRYGMQETVNAPSFQRYSRTISKYSYVLSETNQHGGLKTYTYDDLGRVVSEDLISPFNDINYSWRPDNENKVVVTQGENTITKYWDGMGRDTGYIENGDERTLHYRKTLDGEGRVIEVTSGSIIDPSPKYVYVLDATGRTIQMTDPVSNVTHISYLGISKTVTDPKDHSTTYEYNDLPGQPTKIADAQGHIANYTYDALGRLTEIEFNNHARIQSYEYDHMGRITSETHPETGEIEYTYNSDNRLDRKTWGGTALTYRYNISGQLTTLLGAETVSYEYDDKGRISLVSGSTGWRRDGFTYNAFGAITREDILIPGLASKSVLYDYDGNGNLKLTTYPDGKIATTEYNGLNKPEKLKFGQPNLQSTLVDAASYGPNKMLASMSIVGNQTSLSFTSTFNNDGRPNTVALTKDSTPLYNSTYTYDGDGNIIGTSSTAPSPSMNATFGYDSLNRLTSAAYTLGNPGALNYSYEYDEYGNMKKVTGGVGFEKNYDSSNRIEGYTYDSRGNLTVADGKAYYWDSQNRLTFMMDATGQYLADYRYDDRGLRIASFPPVPDIDVRGYSTNSSADLTSSLNSPCDKTFTIDNLGRANLALTGLSITGQDAGLFTVQQQPASPVSPTQSTTFIIRFLPTSTGDKIAVLSISSNDPDEGSYIINLNGLCEPEMSISGVGNGGTYDFGTVTVGESTVEDLFIQNTGTATLVLYAGWPISIEEPGGEANFSLVFQEGTSRISPSGSNIFSVRFAPTGEGVKTATITIENNDLNENPYTITLEGTGLNGPAKISDGTSLTILSPNGGEKLDAGSFQDITWKGGDALKCVKIEYSTDNGSTYHTIVERVANIGTFPWLVPTDLSESCLIRISDPDGAPTMPVFISYEFNFKVSVPEDQAKEASHFTFRAGLPDQKSQSYQVAEVSFAPDGLKGSENLLFNYAVADVQSLGQFLGTWHHARITYDMTNYSGSVWLDNQPVLSNVPLNTDLDVQKSPEISLSGNPGIPMKVWIDDVDVRFLDQSLIVQGSTEVEFKPLFKDNFARYERALFPRQGGWIPGQELVDGNGTSQGKKAQESGAVLETATAEKLMSSSAIDDAEYVSSSKSFKLEDPDSAAGLVVKRFSLPARAPFCISAENFGITSGSQDSKKETDIGGLLDRERADESEDRTSERQANKTANLSRRMSSGAGLAEAVNTETSRAQSSAAAGGGTSPKLLSGIRTSSAFYIYSYDGRLLSEYTISGVEQICVRDYIYFGGQLVAEYQPAGANFYYYSSDQINSTRIVTDSSGTVKYSVAYDPYGGIQHNWENSYDPSLKFSGKERDSESDLDYFGSRYYDRTQYRFLSTDPISHGANLYSYCMNNPINFFDPNGEQLVECSPPLPQTPGNEWFHNYLSSTAQVAAQNFITLCGIWGINITLKEAYRTPAEHQYLQATNPNAAVGWSRHCAGNAFDVGNWGSYSVSDIALMDIAASACGLTRIVNSNPNDPNHFQLINSSNPTDKQVEHAYGEYVLDQKWNILMNWYIWGGDDDFQKDQALYMLYGVFTWEAACRVLIYEEWLLENEEH